MAKLCVAAAGQLLHGRGERGGPDAPVVQGAGRQQPAQTQGPTDDLGSRMSPNQAGRDGPRQHHKERPPDRGRALGRSSSEATSGHPELASGLFSRPATRAGSPCHGGRRGAAAHAARCRTRALRRGIAGGAARRIVEAEDQARARLLAALAARRVRVGYVDIAANSTHYSGFRSGFHSG